MTEHEQIQASDTPDDSVTVTPEDQAPALVATASRTVSGRVLPWDEMGRTSNGVLSFAPGAINVPTDISRVKLLAGHSPDGVPVGHAVSWESRDDGLYMTFQMGSSSAADDALTSASEHVVDAFSVEAYGIERDGTAVKRSILSAVALVPMPAFASARVDTVNASAPPADAAPAEDTDDTDTAADPAEDTDDTAEDSEDRDDDTDDDTDTAEDDDTAAPDNRKETMSKTNLRPGTLPGAHSAPAETVHASLGQVTDYLSAAVRGEATDGLLAELTDITDSGTISRHAPAWLGELWNGVPYERTVIPLVQQEALTSRKVRGYRWKKKPGVGAYKGDKSDIPTFPVELEAVERDAERWAGGNDLDRVFWDFGETEFLAAYWKAMAESYAYQTDAAMAKFIQDNATNLTGGGDNIIDAVIRGSLDIHQKLHTPATFVLVNPTDYAGILGMNALDKPVFIDQIPHLDPKAWVTSDLVKAGTVVVGSKAAATHYELSGSPLRVEAEHIAKGGRDAALFGYTAKMINRPEGLRKVSFAKAPTPPKTDPKPTPAPDNKTDEKK